MQEDLGGQHPADDHAAGGRSAAERRRGGTAVPDLTSQISGRYRSLELCECAFQNEHAGFGMVELSGVWNPKLSCRLDPESLGKSRSINQD